MSVDCMPLISPNCRPKLKTVNNKNAPAIKIKSPPLAAINTSKQKSSKKPYITFKKKTKKSKIKNIKAATAKNTSDPADESYKDSSTEKSDESIVVKIIGSEDRVSLTTLLKLRSGSNQVAKPSL